VYPAGRNSDIRVAEATAARPARGHSRLMPRTRDEGRIAEAVRLAASGMTQAEVAGALGVSVRTLSRWPVQWPTGRPRLPDGQGSRWTRRRRGELSTVTGPDVEQDAGDRSR
jgi:transposase